jgi:hypothetical protein
MEREGLDGAELERDGFEGIFLCLSVTKETFRFS